jgi:hypothetical protein
MKNENINIEIGEIGAPVNAAAGAAQRHFNVIVMTSHAQRLGQKEAPPSGRGQVGPGTLKMASALPRRELGRSG